MRSLTRSPNLTSMGVQEGPALPLIVSQLNSIANVFGTVLLGSSAHLLHSEVRVVKKGPVLV